MTKTQDLFNRFAYHKPDEEKIVLHQDIRDGAYVLAQDIDTFVPDSREKALALTALEEAMMWANAGIARN
jgi:hypothetical protein